MPKCFTCKTELTGSWTMTKDNPTYDETGRYLGVNAHFAYGEGTNWVYSYCNACWKNQILSLSFVANRGQNEATYKAQVTDRDSQINTLKQQVQTLTADNAQKTTRVNELQAQVSKLTAEKQTLTTENGQKSTAATQLQAQLAQLTAEKQALTTDNTQKNNRVNELQNQLNQLTQSKQRADQKIVQLAEAAAQADSFKELNIDLNVYADMKAKLASQMTDLQVEVVKTTLADVQKSLKESIEHKQTELLLRLAEEFEGAISSNIERCKAKLEQIEKMKSQIVDQLKQSSIDLTEEQMSKVIDPLKEKAEKEKNYLSKLVEFQKKINANSPVKISV